VDQDLDWYNDSAEKQRLISVASCGSPTVNKRSVLIIWSILPQYVWPLFLSHRLRTAALWKQPKIPSTYFLPALWFSFHDKNDE